MLSEKFNQFLERYEKRIAKVDELDKKISTHSANIDNIKSTVVSDLKSELKDKNDKTEYVTKSELNNLTDTVINLVVESEGFSTLVKAYADQKISILFEKYEKEQSEIRAFQDLIFEDISKLSVELKTEMEIYKNKNNGGEDV